MYSPSAFLIDTADDDELVLRDTPACTIDSTQHVNADRSYDEHHPDRQLLHERFAHAHIDTLTGLHSSQPLPKSLRPLCACTTCMMTQQSEKPKTPTQTQSSEHASKPLARINIDLHGPYPEASFGSYQYVFVVIDSFSGHCFAQPIVHKSDAVDVMRTYVQQI